jgi:sortase A
MFVLSGATGNTLAFGPGHLVASSDFDQQGTKIVAAHRDTHFNFLKNIVVGDKLVITDLDGRKLGYQVASLEIVDSRHSTLKLEQSIDQLVLVTCFPFDAMAPTTLRYKVIAKPVVNQAFLEGKKS